MKTLAIDFSTDRRAVYLNYGTRGPATVSQFNRKVGALALIEAVFAKAEAERTELERIVLGLGPGSYTGIRSSIALAHGWVLGASVQLHGVSSEEAIARSSNHEGEFLVVSDAQRGEFYVRRYQRSGDELTALSDLRIDSRESVDTIAKSGVRLLGPEIVKQFGGGDIVHPDPERLLDLIHDDAIPVSGEGLEPICLRNLEFKKAPPARVVD